MESCGNLGLMNEKGWGKEKDPGRAIELYEQACRAGVPVHCRNVGRLSEGDSGFPVDPERAGRAYQRALELALEQCEERVAESCAVAGYLYKDGKGTGENMERARMLLRKSCKMGYSWACKSL
ncbi:MAG TPA: tetratricopeptide repeat protein [Gammaproteobacteria bacterium]